MGLKGFRFMYKKSCCDLRMVLGLIKHEPTINAKPKWFARIEKIVSESLVNPLASFGAALITAGVETEVVVKRNKVLELVHI